MRHILLTATHLALLLSLLVPTVPAAGQSPRQEPEVHIWTDPAIATILLVDSLDTPSARALVIRRPGDLPNNIIVVTRATTARELSKAVTAIIASRRSKGDRVDREMRTIITAAASSRSKPSRDETRAATDLRRLRNAPYFAVHGVGRGPAIVIRMADASAPRRKAGER